MNPQNNREEALRQREQELRDREMQIRLRQLEADITQPPVMPTRKHHAREPELQPRKRKLIQTAKWIGLAIGGWVLVVIVFRVVNFLASVAIVGLIGWLIYKLLLERDKQ